MSPLAEPLRLGPLEVPNRVMQAAHSKQFSDRVESPRETAYFVRRAEGGCGLFVAGNHMIHPDASTQGFQDAWRPESVVANQAMTSAIHDAGAKVLVQLNHHGAQAAVEGPDGPRPVYGPSRLISPATGRAAHALSRAQIAELVKAWAESAALAREGGFDGVEIHMAHGYLLHQFLSPIYNTRADEYGGDLDGRTRFPREVLKAVRDAVGDDFPVGIRIVLNEHNARGLDAAECREIVARLRQDARLDFLDPAAGDYHDVHWIFPSSAMPVAWLRQDVAALKEANPDVAVFGVGCALSVEESAEVVESGIADNVALTRGQLADPDLASKLISGRTDEIIHCIRLNQACLGRGSLGLPISCTVNPAAGRELDPPPARTAEPLHWAIVGGGPAGTRAATDLARQGHQVTLFEARRHLGGQAFYASRIVGRESIGLLLADQKRDLERAGVTPRLGEAATVDALRELAPDRVVLATGAAPASEVMGTGFDGPPPETVDASEALRRPDSLGSTVVVVDEDGTHYASALLLSLVAAGVEAEVVTPFERLLPHVGLGYERQLVMETLATGMLSTVTSSRVADRGTGLVVIDNATGNTRFLGKASCVVRVAPGVSVLLEGRDAGDLENELGIPVVTIGDATGTRGLDAAILQAWKLTYSAKP